MLSNHKESVLKRAEAIQAEEAKHMQHHLETVERKCQDALVHRQKSNEKVKVLQP